MCSLYCHIDIFIYENNIITGGKKKIYENETIDFFEKVSVIKEGKILKKFILLFLLFFLIYLFI